MNQLAGPCRCFVVIRADELGGGLLLVRAVVAYDVSLDRRRRKVAAALEAVLVRVQYSVFEGEVPSEVLAAAVGRAVGWLDLETDSLRVYRLCGACAERVEVFGRERVVVEHEAVRIL